VVLRNAVPDSARAVVGIWEKSRVDASRANLKTSRVGVIRGRLSISGLTSLTGRVRGGVTLSSNEHNALGHNCIADQGVVGVECLMKAGHVMSMSRAWVTPPRAPTSCISTAVADSTPPMNAPRCHPTSTPCRRPHTSLPPSRRRPHWPPPPC